MDPIGRLLPDSNVKGGVCFALSSLWIRRHKNNKGETAAKRIEFLGLDSTIFHAAIMQRLYGAEYVDDTTGGHERAQNVAMDYRGMKYNDRSYEKFAPFSDDVSDENVKDMLAGMNTPWSPSTSSAAARTRPAATSRAARSSAWARISTPSIPISASSR
jgi:hypothetical protein